MPWGFENPGAKIARGKMVRDGFETEKKKKKKNPAKRLSNAPVTNGVRELGARKKKRIPASPIDGQ